MSQDQFKRAPSQMLAAASLFLIAATPVLGQEQTLGGQKLSFGFKQTVGANDNIRLDNKSVGTTYFSDTDLSFGFSNQTASDSLIFSLGGVLRAVNDPIVGTEAGFRDPSARLSYTRSNANTRLTLDLDYKQRDLAFLNPLEKTNISDQDIYSGGGTLEEYTAGLQLETGMQAPLGFILSLDSSGSSYRNTTDPLLFSSRTDSASITSVLRFSSVTEGQFNLYGSRYSADDLLGSQTDTRTLSFNLSHEFSDILSLNASVGHSNVTESYDNFPGLETVTSGPVGNVSLLRKMTNGEVSATLGTTLSEVGRQDTLEFRRLLDLPAGKFEFSFGASQGTGFDPLPIGRLFYTADFPTGKLTAGVERYVDISSTLSAATQTTRFTLGYDYRVNDLSALSFDLYYANISYARNRGLGPSRERGSFNATYTRSITPDWDLLLGYEYGYFDDATSDGLARSSQVTLSLQRDFDIFQ